VLGIVGAAVASADFSFFNRLGRMDQLPDCRIIGACLLI
jgi:hypothetical protein